MPFYPSYFFACIVSFPFGAIGVFNALRIYYKKAAVAGLAPLFYTSLAN